MSKSLQAVIYVDRDHRLWIIGYNVHCLVAEVVFSYASFCNVRYDSLEVALAELLEKIYTDREIKVDMAEIVFRSKDRRIISLIHKLMLNTTKFHRLYHLNRGIEGFEGIGIWVRSKMLDKFKHIFFDHPYAVAVGWCPISCIENADHLLLGMKLKEAGVSFREKLINHSKIADENNPRN